MSDSGRAVRERLRSLILFFLPLRKKNSRDDFLGDPPPNNQKLSAEIFSQSSMLLCRVWGTQNHILDAFAMHPWKSFSLYLSEEQWNSSGNALWLIPVPPFLINWRHVDSSRSPWQLVWAVCVGSDNHCDLILGGGTWHMMLHASRKGRINFSN